MPALRSGPRKKSPRNHALHLPCLGIAAVVAILLTAAPAAAGKDLPLAYFQGLVGAAGFNEERLTFAEQTPGDPSTVSANDLSTMPYLGIAGQYALSGGESHFGIDASLFFGWRSDDSSIGVGNGQARVEIDSDLWLADLAIGLYAQTILGSRWRLYGAIGPMILFGEYADDTEEQNLTVTPATVTKTSNSESGFGMGGYAKLGMEYRLGGDAFMGVAVRGVATNLEFDQAIEGGDLTGLQGFVTFTRAY